MLSSELSFRNLRAFSRAKVQKFIGSIFMFVYRPKNSQCLAKKSICRHIQPHCHQFRMNAVSFFFLLIFIHSRQWSKFSMFVFFPLCMNVYAFERVRKSWGRRMKIAIFYQNIKIDIFIGDEESEDVLTLNWKFLILFSRKQVETRKQFSFPRTPKHYGFMTFTGGRHRE